MRRLTVFNSISLDGYFTGPNDDMSAFHARSDAEWNKFTSENAGRGSGTLLFGRKTYEQMRAFWPTKEAKAMLPEVSEGMARLEKVVLSRTMKEPGWSNARVVSGDLAGEVRKLKKASGEPILIMGSGSIVAQLTKERLIDTYTMVIWPFVFGAGRTMFEGVEEIVDLKKVDERQFANGNIVVTYELKK